MIGLLIRKCTSAVYGCKLCTLEYLLNPLKMENFYVACKKGQFEVVELKVTKQILRLLAWYVSI